MTKIISQKSTAEPEGEFLTVEQARTHFLNTRSDKMLLLVTGVMAVVYFLFLTFVMPPGNKILFYLLVAGEVYHLWLITTYLYTVWQQDYQPRQNKLFAPAVDIYITVAGEPVDVVEETARAALALSYPNFKVFLLNDGYVAKKDNWQDIELLAERLGITCLTRKVAGGAKAGNINHALRNTTAPFVAIFDADQVPHKDFLRKTVPLMADTSIGFVQSPQFYKNFAKNEITAGAWEQQELFFGPVCKGKNRLNSTFMCGTNMLVRKAALLSAGGMCETNIAEDFLTSLFIHEQGWQSVYVPEVLAEGLAPEDFLSYCKQQFRWARGSLEVLFRYNPLFRPRLSWPQKLQYLASSSFYISGLVVFMNAMLPLLFFYFGLIPLKVSTMGLAAIFLPYIFLSIATLQTTSNYSFTFRAISFSMSSFTIHLQAVWAVLTNQKSSFAVTSKKQLSGNFWTLSLPHMAYLTATAVGVVMAILREGVSAAFLSNLSWALFNCAVFSSFITASFPALSSFPQTNEPLRQVPTPNFTQRNIAPSVQLMERSSSDFQN